MEKHMLLKIARINCSIISFLILQLTESHIHQKLIIIN